MVGGGIKISRDARDTCDCGREREREGGREREREREGERERERERGSNVPSTKELHSRILL